MCKNCVMIKKLILNILGVALVFFILLGVFILGENETYEREMEEQFENERKNNYETMIDFIHPHISYPIIIKNYKYMFKIYYSGKDKRVYSNKEVKVKIDQDGIVIYKNDNIFEIITMDKIHNYVMENLRKGTSYKNQMADSFSIWVNETEKMTLINEKSKMYIKKIRYPIENKKLIDMEMEFYIK